MNILLASSLRASKTFCETFFGATYIHCEAIQAQFNILSQKCKNKHFFCRKLRRWHTMLKKLGALKLCKRWKLQEKLKQVLRQPLFLCWIWAPLSYTLGAIMVSTKREFTFWEPLLQPLDGRGYRCFNRICFFEGKHRRHEIPSECTSPGGGKFYYLRFARGLKY